VHVQAGRQADKSRQARCNWQGNRPTRTGPAINQHSMQQGACSS
jgi:hypothetical protein